MGWAFRPEALFIFVIYRPTIPAIKVYDGLRMKHAVGGNGHPAMLHSEFETSPRSAADLLHRFRYGIQNNRTIQRARETVVHYVQEHGAKDIAANMGRLIRQKPGTALLLAAAAGFLIGRSIRRR